MNIKVWAVRSRGQKATYFALLDEFESLPNDSVKVVGNMFVPSEDVLIESDDLKVLLSKLNKKIEKEVKHLIKDGN